MKSFDIGNSKFLAALDFRKDEEYVFTIRRRIPDADVVEVHKPEDQEDEEPWCVIYFTETPKGFVLNTTKARQIAAVHGTESDQWEGKQIVLYRTTCALFGKTVPCIRVREEAPAAKQNKHPVRELVE